MSPTAAITFGDLLRQLRKRGGMTQADLAAAVGYSAPFISNLELNERLPDIQVITQRFIPALGLHAEPQLAARLVALAADARGQRLPLAASLPWALPFHDQPDVPPQSWPMAPTELLGREQEVKTICSRLLDHDGRLLTLIGPPGIGKTRLGLAAAGKLQAMYHDGAYFVPLAAVSDPELVTATLVSELGIEETAARAPTAWLIDFLRRKEVLLLLDNFEQITPAAPLVAELLAACPGLRVLVTSRERLHLRAERRYRVPPLGLEPALALFAQRAHALDSGFVLTPGNRAIFCQICEQLDCLPLAIELCAAHMDLMTPDTLLARLRDNRLDLLADGPQDLPPHQRTLRSAIARSYLLLDEPERSAFRALGVCRGEFTWAAVATMGVEQGALLSLVHKSLVQLAPRQEETPRFALLETLREFAWERLCAEGEAAVLQRRHAESYLRFAEEAARHLRGPDEAIWLDRLAVDQANLRAALAWSVDQGETEIGARLGIALWRFWNIRGYYEEGAHWLQALLAQDVQPAHCAQLLYAQGILARRRGDMAAANESLSASLALCRAFDDRRAVASALRALGFIHYLQNDRAGARPLLEEALTIFRALDEPEGTAAALDGLAYISHDPAANQRLFEESLALRRCTGNLRGVAMSLAGLTHVAFDRGDLVAAQTYAQEHLQINQRLGSRAGMASSLSLLGRSAFEASDYILAREYFEECLRLRQATGDGMELPEAYASLARTLSKLGDAAAAQPLLEQALPLFHERGNTYCVAEILACLAGVAVAQGLGGRALCLAGAAARICDSSHEHFPPTEQAEFDAVRAAAWDSLSPEAAAAAWHTGQAMTPDQAVAFALDTAPARPAHE